MLSVTSRKRLHLVGTHQRRPILRSYVHVDRSLTPARVDTVDTMESGVVRLSFL